jgi:hypothetical protein
MVPRFAVGISARTLDLSRRSSVRRISGTNGAGATSYFWMAILAYRSHRI